MIMCIQTFAFKDAHILLVPYTIEVDMSPHNFVFLYFFIFLFFIYKKNWGEMNKSDCERKMK